MAINFFTAYLLQTLGKLSESLNFIMVAEKMLHRLLTKLGGRDEGKEKSCLELIHEEGTVGGTSMRGTVKSAQPHPAIPDKGASMMTKALLSNYLLGI